MTDIINSEFDDRTVYRLRKKDLSVIRDGESITFTYGVIPERIKLFVPEVGEELMDIWRSRQTKANCVVCGKEFYKLHNATTCSPECRAEYERSYRERNIKLTECIVCGKEFYSKGRKTCSAECLRERKSAASMGNKNHKPSRKKHVSHLDEKVARAKELGISYGQLVAMEYMEKEGGFGVSK